LKDALTTTPVLQATNPTLPYKVTTDASDLALGAVLMQEGHPVAYHSQKFNDAEINYATHEKEMLAIVDTLIKWQSYLEGAHFTIITDHKSLTNIKTQATLSRKQA